MIFKGDGGGMAAGANVKKPRIQSIDILKGGAIIGVVAAHLMFIQNSQAIEDSFNFVFNAGELLYAALPMFLVLSGYFYKPGDLWYNIKRKVIPLVTGLVVCTVVLTVIMYYYLGFLGYDLSNSDFWGDIIEIVIGKGYFEDIYGDKFTGEMILDVYEVTLPYYFLQIMAVGYLIFFPIVDYTIKNWKRLVAVSFVLLTITCVYMELVHIQLPFYAQLGPLVAVFYLIGAFMAKHNVAHRLEDGYREKRYWMILGALIIASVACICIIPTNMALIYSEFGDYGGFSVYTFVITSMTCGMVLFYCAALGTHIPWLRDVLSLPGRASLAIFALHMFVAKLIVAPFVELNTETWIPLTSTPLSLLLAVCTVFMIAIILMTIRKLLPKNITEIIEDEEAAANTDISTTPYK